MNQQMLNLITNSQHVSTGKYFDSLTPSATRGKALSLLNTVSRKRNREMFPQSFQDADTNVTANMTSTSNTAEQRQK